MKVLLTGAFGNLGSLVLGRLLDEGHQVTAFDVPSPINQKIGKGFARRTNLNIAWGDIRNAEYVKRLVKGCDAIVHVAAIIAPFSEKIPELAFDVNVNGTQNLIDGIRESGGSPLLVFTSSFAVYGHRQNDPPPRTLDEPVVATDHYSAHKIEGETRVQAMATPWVILRLAGMVDGRMRHRDKEQARMGFRLAANNRIEYVHPADVTTAIVHALERPAAHHKIHLIGGGPSCQVTQIDMMQAVMDALGIPVMPTDFGDDELYADWSDTAESQRLLEYQNHSFDDFRHECRQRFRFIRPLARPFSILIRRAMFKAIKA